MKIKTKINGYSDSLKGVSIFGGVQVINIIVNVLRVKFIAIFLGASSFGAISIYNSLILLISTFTAFGMPTVIIREIASSDIKDIDNSAKTIQSVLNITFIVSFFGIVLTVLFSPILSFITFKNFDRIFDFLILGVAIFFTNYVNCLTSIYQALQKLSLLAKANIVGLIVTLCCSILIIFILKEDGIIYYILLYPIINFCTLIYFLYKGRILRNYHLRNTKLDFSLIKSRFKLGFSIVLTTLIVYLIGYLLKIYINENGDLSEVGYFDAAWVINSAYVGIVFTALASDYYPKLVQVVNIKKDLLSKVIAQAEITLFLLFPLIFFMILLAEYIIQILYAKDFIVAIIFLRLLLIGSFIKSLGWIIAYIHIAKGNNRVYIISELLVNSVSLFLYIYLYDILGLKGLGYSYIITYILYLLVNIYIMRKKYIINLNYDGYKLFLVFTFLLVVLYGYLMMEYKNNLLLILIIVIASTYYFYEINKRVSLVKILNKIFIKKQ